MESQGLADSSNLVFQTIQKSGVEEAAERAISIVLDVGGEAVEVHNILCNAVCILHSEVFKLVLGIGDGVMRSECALELSNEVNPAVHPAWTVSWISGVQEVQFKPF